MVTATLLLLKAREAGGPLRSQSSGWLLLAPRLQCEWCTLAANTPVHFGRDSPVHYQARNDSRTARPMAQLPASRQRWTWLGDAGPGAVVGRQVLPLAASAEHGEDALDDLPHGAGARAAGGGGRQERLQQRPFGVGQVGGIGDALHAAVCADPVPASPRCDPPQLAISRTGSEGPALAVEGGRANDRDGDHDQQRHAGILLRYL